VKRTTRLFSVPSGRPAAEDREQQAERDDDQREQEGLGDRMGGQQRGEQNERIEVEEEPDRYPARRSLRLGLDEEEQEQERKRPWIILRRFCICLLNSPPLQEGLGRSDLESF